MAIQTMRIPTNRTWSDPETMGPIHYINEFGEVILQPVTDYMPVAQIDTSTTPEIEQVLISLDTAEQVVLITDNRRAGVSTCFPFRPANRAAFAIKYCCASRAAVCSVTVVRFTAPNGVSAQQQIENMAPKAFGPIPA